MEPSRIIKQYLVQEGVEAANKIFCNASPEREGIHIYDTTGYSPKSTLDIREPTIKVIVQYKNGAYEKSMEIYNAINKLKNKEVSGTRFYFSIAEHEPAFLEQRAGFIVYSINFRFKIGGAF